MFVSLSVPLAPWAEWVKNYHIKIKRFTRNKYRVSAIIVVKVGFPLEDGALLGDATRDFLLGKADEIAVSLMGRYGLKEISMSIGCEVFCEDNS